MSKWYKPLSPSDVECLIRWPQNSVGERQEREVLATLLRLCEQEGYGRIPQLARQIENIWRDKKQIAQYELEKQNHLKLFAE